MKIIFRILFVTFICSILLSLLHTHGNFILFEYVVYYLWLIPSVLMIEFIRSRVIIDKTIQSPIDANILSGLIIYIFLLLALVSSWNHLTWFYFIEWRHGHVPSFHYFEAGFIRFIYLTQILVVLFLFLRKRISAAISLILFLTVVICLAVFLSKTKGIALYRDDHPCFIYRLWEFIKTFPQFINYNPDWNAGVCDYSGVETGTISLGFLFWPLWKIFNIANIYTYVYAFVFIVFIPLVFVFSLKMIKGDWISAWCAGLLSVGVSQYYFIWLFQYGTTGALLSSVFLVPLACGVFRVVWLDKREWWLAVVIVLSGFMFVMWPPNLLIGIGILFSIIFSVKKLSKKKILYLVLCFFIFFILYFKIFAVIARPSTLKDISGAVNYGNKNIFLTFLSKEVLINGWNNLVDIIKEGHPLVVFFGLGGIILFWRRDIKFWFLPIIVFLMLCSGWGEQLSSELQFTRMLISLFFICIIPASLWIGNLLNVQNIRFSIVQAGLAALLALSGWNCVRMYNNDGFARYETMPKDIQELVKWIKENTQVDGRILLAGSNMHAYGGGHAVVLPYLTEREMLACDYVQFSTKGGIDYFPPSVFRETKEKLFQYMELYNITYVIAWEDGWMNIFRVYPDQYIEEITIGDKTIFKVNRKPNMFLEGEGTVKSDFNLLKVHTDNPDNEIVIKYNWLTRLSAEEPAQIFPFDAGYGIKFIGIHPNGEKDVLIKYKNWL